MENQKSNQWLDLFNKQKSQVSADNQLTEPERINSYIFIYDCFENSILYFNSAFETITGHEHLSLEFLLEIIHPDDLPYFFEHEEKGLAFTNTLQFNEHFRYTLSYTYRIRKADGNYLRILQECQAIEVNNSGHLTKTFVTHKVLPYTEVRAPKDYKIFDKTQNIYIDSENTYHLSKRELEILHLIKLGYNSSEVADKLNLSKNTVITHRKNILNKTKTKSFIELIKKLSYQHY